MRKAITSAIVWFLVFLAAPLSAVLSITPGDIQFNSYNGRYYYRYYLTFNDMSTAKFANDVYAQSNVTAELFPVENYGVFPTAGQSSASFTYRFDFSAIQLFGMNVTIDYVVLRDKIYLRNNLLNTEESALLTSWSVNGVNYTRFNEGESPIGHKVIEQVQESTLATIADGAQTFYYQARFTNRDSSGFDNYLTVWNYQDTQSSSDYFLVEIYLSFPGSPAGTYAGGDGSAGAPYQIATPAQLDAVRDYPGDWDKHFILVADLDMKDYTYPNALIASSNNYDYPSIPFTGTFDGGGHTIRNLTIDATSGTCSFVAMFGYLSNAAVSNLTLEKTRILGHPRSTSIVAPLAGYAYDTAFTNSRSVETTAVGLNYVAGLIATTNGSQGQNMAITNCSAQAALTCDSMGGGLIGYAVRSNVSHCWAEGAISIFTATTASKLGGLVGGATYVNLSESWADTALLFVSQEKGLDETGGFVGSLEASSCSNCYAKGAIVAAADLTYDVGGFAGMSSGSQIAYCYSLGRVHSTTAIPAGFLGFDEYYYPSTYTACFWDTTTSGTTNGEGASGSADPAGISGYPTNIMKLLGNYTTVGWDFVDETANGTADIWTMIENETYPFFAGQCLRIPFGDLNRDCIVDLVDFAQIAQNWLDCGYYDTSLCGN